MDDEHGVKSSKLLGCEQGSWPELVGMAATPAVNQIKQDRPDVTVEVHPQGSQQPPVPGDNPKRVCVFVDSLGNVATAPYVG